MATDELLPPACAFAVSVLAEYAQEPDAVPEEAVEAAQQHMASCPRCKQASVTTTSSPITSTPRKKKKKVRSGLDLEAPIGSLALPNTYEPAWSEFAQAPIAANASSLQEAPPLASMAPVQTLTPATLTPAPFEAEQVVSPPPTPEEEQATSFFIDCQQCRQLLPEYTEALDSGQDVAALYPEVQAHLLICENGCLVLVDLFRQEAKATRKFRRKPVRDPFSAIGWEISGFFRGGQIPMAPRALAYGTLMLLLLVASLGAYLGVRWDDARYYRPPVQAHLLPTPDGIGLSDGLRVYDACSTTGYQAKREAAQALAHNQLDKAEKLLASASNNVDSSGCNSAEAAIYHEDLQVRRSGHPFGIVVVSFDSGPGNADPTGGTDRHNLYAAYTQELVGAYISQQTYNQKQLQTTGAPLLYLVLANTTGVEEGALQVANDVAELTAKGDFQHLGLQVTGPAPILSVLGLAPSSLVQVVLPVLCRAGVPLIAPTASGLFIVDMLTQTSLYRHCTPGFAFTRFSPDDAAQSGTAADYAYQKLGARHATLFYDPSNPSSKGSAQYFNDRFTHHRGAHVVSQEAAVASGLLDANGRPQASRDDLLAGLHDALQSHPDLIFAPLLTNDVITLAEAIAQLPQNQQPILLIGGEFVQPTGLQKLVPWARQNQFTLPRIYVAVNAAAHPPDPQSDWPKQFYASFCTSFATPGTFCSGAAALDQGALLFGDGVEMITRSLSKATTLPTPTQLMHILSKSSFVGVSGPINVRLQNDVLITSLATQPAILTLQPDGTIQITS